MPIEITLPDNYFTNDEREKLQVLLEATDDAEFANALGKVVLAGLDEYKSMFLGMGLPSRADEIRQHRLFYLIKRYFVRRLPSEAEVSSMFQLTQSQSKSLIRSVMARFRYELEEEIRNTLVEHIKRAEINNDAGEYRIVIHSDNVLDELNRIIGSIAPNLDQIKKVRNTSRTYAISEDSYEALKRHFKID